MKVKRWLAILLCIAQVLALLAVPVFADEEGGPGGPTAATIPSGVTPVTVTADQKTITADDRYSDGYAYVTFTAAQGCTHTVYAKGAEDSNEDIMMCTDASTQTGTGFGQDAETNQYQRLLTFNANGGDSYVFRIPKFGSGDVTVYVIEGTPGLGGSGNEGGPGGQFTPTADNIYVGGNSPEGIQYIEGVTGTGSDVQYCLGYYDGTKYNILGQGDVTVSYETGNDTDVKPTIAAL